MTDPNPNDELARLLEQHRKAPERPFQDFVECMCGWINEVFTHTAHLSDVILNSDWLSEHDDERWEAGWDMARDGGHD